MRRLILMTLMGLSTFARAQEGVSVTSPEPTLAEEHLERPWRLSLGTVNYRYSEPGYMKLGGQMSQVSGDYRIKLIASSPMFIAIESGITFSTANKYDGAVQNLDTGVITPKVAGSRDTIMETRVIYSATVLNGYSQGVDGYTGLGLWSLYNKISGEGSYGRQANYLYLPVGSTYNLRFGRLGLALSAEYDVYLAGSTTSQMTDVGGSNDIVHQQNSGSGYRAKLESEYRFNGFTLLASVYYQAWNIAASEVTNVIIKKSNGDRDPGRIVEPANRTTMTGFTLGTRF